jgi:Spy/CpxP family protein refolding chaperone
MKVLLGVLVGLMIARVVRHALWRRRMFGGIHAGPFGGGCGWRRGGGRGARWVWMLNELELDPRQKDELGAIWMSLRQTIGAAQVARWRGMSDVVEVATAEPLDRARLDEVAARFGEAQTQAAHEIAAAVARAHESLRPEQRGRVRELVERAGLWRFPRGGGSPPSSGPYR